MAIAPAANPNGVDALCSRNAVSLGREQLIGQREWIMQVIRVGLDVAKNVFQVHGVAADGTSVVRRRLRRQEVLPFFAQLPSCLVGLEACRASHHWACELIALGHDARIMPARYVKPYVQHSTPRPSVRRSAGRPCASRR